LNKSSKRSLKYGEGIFSVISLGFFFIVVGAIFVYTIFVQEIDLFGDIIAFFDDFDIVKVPNTEALILPAPKSPSIHLSVYSAALQFSLIWGLYQIAVLALRFVARSPVKKKAETASNTFSWLATSYVISTFLNESTTTTKWFEFWAITILLIGVSLIIRAAILATARLSQH